MKMKEQLLQFIHKVKNNLSPKINFFSINSHYHHELGENRENKIAQTLLNHQAELLILLHQHHMIDNKFPFLTQKNQKPFLFPTQFDTRDWNQFKQTYKIYLGDLITMVENLILKKPFQASASLKAVNLLAQIVSIRNDLLKIFTPLVLYYAKRHYRFYQTSLTDLQQEGFLGLIYALETFYYIQDSYSIKSYFTFYIKQQIKRFIVDNQCLIKIPYQVSLKMDSQPSESEQYHQFKEYYFSEISDIQDHIDDSLLHYKNEKEEIFNQIWEKTLKKIISQLISILTPKEQEVIQLRYGINSYQPHTLEEIGKKLHLTRERIRQIENKALEKIQRNNTILFKEDLVEH